ncbi:MAG: sel1 repeat family protein [Gammaproteobacteria bacterium]|nr:sel1 repeat family protein [Gammaproteobacteria bacterium]
MIHYIFKFSPFFLKTILFTQILLSPPVLADAKTDGDKGIEEYRQGNIVEGLMLMESSAKQGYAPAQVTLAFILDHAENDKDAFHWYQQAAEQDSPAGLFGLGNMYGKGEGTEKDPVKAGELIKKSADMQHSPAMRALAYALENGSLGFKKNESDALQWYLKAAEAGDDFSMLRLKKAYSTGELGLAADADQAAEWERKLQIKQEKRNGD